MRKEKKIGELNWAGSVRIYRYDNDNQLLAEGLLIGIFTFGLRLGWRVA